MNAQPPTSFNGYALIIGVGNYPYIKPLPQTVNDAKALHQILTDPQRAGYTKENVRMLTNAEASKENILEGLQWLKDSVKGKPEATALIYYSGHGGLINNKYYLLPYMVSTVTWPDYVINKETFTKAVNAIEAGKLMVFLDCCYAGGLTAKGTEDFEFIDTNQELYEALQKGSGRVVVASSKGDQKSLILGNAQYSAFTTALIDALDYHADDGNGYASVLKTLSHISTRLKKDTHERQTPLFNLEQSEDFLICRINRGFTEKSPFLGDAAERNFTHSGNATPGDAAAFRQLLVAMLDKRGFEAVPEILGMIGDSPYTYNKPTLANLRAQAGNMGTTFFPDPYITQLKVFIGSIH
jgi:Caspase domain